VFIVFTISMLFSVVWWWWWWACVGDYGAVLVKFGWVVVVYLDSDLVSERFTGGRYTGVVGVV